MLTFFTLPKGFIGPLEHAQKNAIESWLQLTPKPEIILFGDETGTKSYAQAIQAKNSPQVAASPIGTPFINDMVTKANDTATTPYLGYINTDIILAPNFMTVVQAILKNYPTAVLVSQRWDIDTAPLNLDLKTNKNWYSDLKKELSKKGILMPKSTIDVIIFPAGLYRNMPAFTIGHPGAKYDNWMLCDAKKNNHPLIDITEATVVMHQTHPARAFHELPKEKQAEHMRSLRLAGGYGYCFDIADADFRVTSDLKIIPNPKPKNHIKRQLKRTLQRLIDPIRLRLPWIHRPR